MTAGDWIQKLFISDH